MFTAKRFFFLKVSFMNIISVSLGILQHPDGNVLIAEVAQW